MKYNVYRKTLMAAVIVAAFAMLTSFMPQYVFAGTNEPVTVDIPITYIVDGNAKTAGGDTFVLTADDPLSPMPEGTEAGKKTVTIGEEGSYSFGEIGYETPGVYWYTVTRDLTKKKGVRKDDSVYRAKVIALNDGHGYVLVYKSGSDKKSELVYRDSVAPHTGDSGGLAVWGSVTFAAALLLAGITAARRKKKN